MAGLRRLIMRVLTNHEIDQVSGGFGVAGAVIGGSVGLIDGVRSGLSPSEIAFNTFVGAVGGASGAGMATWLGRVGVAIRGNWIANESKYMKRSS